MISANLKTTELFREMKSQDICDIIYNSNFHSGFIVFVNLKITVIISIVGIVVSYPSADAAEPLQELQF